MTNFHLWASSFLSVLIVVSATAAFSAPSLTDTVALISCASSLVSLASMGINLAILSLVLSSKDEVKKSEMEHKKIELDINVTSKCCKSEEKSVSFEPEKEIESNYLDEGEDDDEEAEEAAEEAEEAEDEEEEKTIQ